VTHTSRSKEEIETNSVDKVPEPTLINYSGPPIVKVIDLELYLDLSVIETFSGFNLGYGRTALDHCSNWANPVTFRCCSDRYLPYISDI
jgi:hypothetical protein